MCCARWGVPGTAQERTFIALKPDAVQRGLVGAIISRFEGRGYKLVALKMHYPTKTEAQNHYADLSKKVRECFFFRFGGFLLLLLLNLPCA